MSLEPPIREHNQGHGLNGDNKPASSAREGTLPVSHPNKITPTIVSLAFLSEHIPASWVTEELARLLRAETGESAVLVRFKGPDASEVNSNGHDPSEPESASAMD